MFAVGVCDLPETGGSTFVLVAGLFVLVAGVIVTRWVRQSAGRMSVVVAPLVLLGGLALAPQFYDPCATTTTVPVTTTVAASTTTTTVALTCATGGSCAVGDTGPGGGIVFYDAGSSQDWGRYLEAACAGWQNNCDGTTADPQAEWGCRGIPLIGADGLAIGTGAQNTANILADCSETGIAADLADDYSHNSLDDWFLPSQLDLYQVYQQRQAIGIPDGFYWSSSEYDEDTAWILNTSIADLVTFTKQSTPQVRPVRAFGPSTPPR